MMRSQERLMAFVFSAVTFCSFSAPVAAEAGLNLTTEVTTGSASFDVCATLLNAGNKPRLVTRPFSFYVTSQLFLIFSTERGQEISLNKKLAPSSSPVFYPPDDRLNYDVVDPGQRLTACETFHYSDFDKNVIVFAQARFSPWIHEGASLPFNQTELDFYGRPPSDGDPPLANLCKIDVKKRRASCSS
jgi:hypothetical protein